MHSELPSTFPRALYRPAFERDSCGFGLLAQVQGEPSSELVRTALIGLERLTHRGAVAADGKSGDGCGLLLAFPETFLREVAAAQGIQPGHRFAAGNVFLAPLAETAVAQRACLERELRRAGFSRSAWRPVPVRPEVLGAQALQGMPRIEQLFVELPPHEELSTCERRLYIARRRAEVAWCASGRQPPFYVCSLSARLLLYKALVLPRFLGSFYPDLKDTRLASHLCLFHQRFSTNTLPHWRIAQPFRHLAHNGEINTIQGNRNWTLARTPNLQSPLLPEVRTLMPIVHADDSDSCSVDNMFEYLLAGGLDLLHAMRILLPPAWENSSHMSPQERAFYHYHALKLEPWDGPAGIVLSDGRWGACSLDRNGLRPARYLLTRNGWLTIASEIGIYDYDPAEVECSGRLGPGQMLAVDTGAGRIWHNEEIGALLAKRRPYRKWLDQHLHSIQGVMEDEERPLSTTPMAPPTLSAFQKFFLLTAEERVQVLQVLGEEGQEAIGSMGDDTPLPVFSNQARSLYESFRQQFAQVTNPPIDSIREQVVMSLRTAFGIEGNLFEARPEHARRVEVKSPVLSEAKFRALLRSDEQVLPSHHLELCLCLEENGLEAAVRGLAQEAVAAVRAGKVLLVLSDRALEPGRLPIPALLAVGAVHHQLVREGLRARANLLVETASVRDPHHFAVLLGYGATAVYPYLAYESLYRMQREGVFPGLKEGAVGLNYRRGINKGLLKILSKMGISTISSYRGAQLFEIVGLATEVVDLCFPETTSRIGGLGFSDIERDLRHLAAEAWNSRKPVRQGGLLKFIHGGEFHAYNPDVVRKLHIAVESDDYACYREFSDAVKKRSPMVLRDLLGLKGAARPLPLEEVEPEERILPRFDSAGMSFGALSPKAHEALAEAMNHLGSRSNSGEGGEDPRRYGTGKSSRIKQIASGRFGVTPHYLMNAEVLQIKIAQGAKPGEGGQLPGHKVDEVIARLRYATPGVSLISPPPHHDIYSIEDLAQLIFDLKQVNPSALVSVKLVAQAGVGTVAVGVTKAYADLITIAGYDGGTGASPLTSVKYAGGPWELGISEAHALLRANALRGKVRLQADGGLKTGLDVVKAALLGAESFGFGTAPMIALGCKYLRICHLNNCATGIATQNEELYTRHFKPDGVAKVIRYFRFLAREVREHMAFLGVRSMDELIGRTEYLEVRSEQAPPGRRLRLEGLLEQRPGLEQVARHCVEERNRPFDRGLLAERMTAAALPAVERAEGIELDYSVKNYHRSIGARLSGEIARRYGNQGMAANPVQLRLRGTAGQSLGVWNAGGLNIHLEGDANDYVGKGMAGGRIVIRPPRESRTHDPQRVIMGNACLYGATGGLLFGAGSAGERFAVRNSGATAVIEGLGDHGCEYMTGGVVVLLGVSGYNFGAGMTGGLAYVFDRARAFPDHYNRDFVETLRLRAEFMEMYCAPLRRLMERHVRQTGSPWAEELLRDWETCLESFWLVKPKSSELSSLLANLRAAA